MVRAKILSPAFVVAMTVAAASSGQIAQAVSSEQEVVSASTLEGT